MGRDEKPVRPGTDGVSAPTLKGQDTIWCRKLAVNSVSSEVTVNMLPSPRVKSHSGQSGNKSETTNFYFFCPVILSAPPGPISVIFKVQQ